MTNPFGNGQGGTGGSKASPNNFLANPAGSAGRKAGGAVADAMKSRDQPAGAPQRQSEINRDTVPAGGEFYLPDVPQTRAAECTITATGSKKPFRVGG